MATCRINEKYPQIECDRPSWDGDPDGLCILHSRQADKDKEGAFTEAVNEKLEKEDYDFKLVFFPARANFSEHIFTKGVDFLWATFSAEADFFGATFSDYADFRGANFLKDVNFCNTKFVGLALLGGNYHGKAEFRWAHFSDILEFLQTEFLDESYFFKATFSSGVRFSNVKFHSLALFEYSNFFGESSFLDNIFYKNASFHDSTFDGTTRLFRNLFLDKANFEYAKIIGKLIFKSVNRQDISNLLPWQSDFRNLQFEPQGKLGFQDLSLAYATLAGTDLFRQCEFINVDWHPLWGRQAVYDEFQLYESEVAWRCRLLRSKWLSWQDNCPWLARLVKTFSPLAESKTFARIRNRNLYARHLFGIEHGKGLKGEKASNEQYARVEECYRYLKLNYEGAGDFKKAGDFHYGEMEMHRRASKWRWLPIYWYNLYRFLSGYGERPLRALLVLAGLLVVFTWWFSGGEGNLPPAWSWGRFWQDCLYILQKATFQRPERQLSSNWGQWLATLSPLLLPGQAALFLLALRNRLGRRR